MALYQDNPQDWIGLLFDYTLSCKSDNIRFSIELKLNIGLETFHMPKMYFPFCILQLPASTALKWKNLPFKTCSCSPCCPSFNPDSNPLSPSPHPAPGQGGSGQPAGGGQVRHESGHQPQAAHDLHAGGVQQHQPSGAALRVGQSQPAAHLAARHEGTEPDPVS